MKEEKSVEIYNAAKNKNPEKIKKIKQEYGSVDIPASNTLFPPITKLAAEGDIESVNFLVKHGEADSNLALFGYTLALKDNKNQENIKQIQLFISDILKKNNNNIKLLVMGYAYCNNTTELKNLEQHKNYNKSDTLAGYTLKKDFDKVSDGPLSFDMLKHVMLYAGIANHNNLILKLFLSLEENYSFLQKTWSKKISELVKNKYNTEVTSNLFVGLGQGGYKDIIKEWASNENHWAAAIYGAARTNRFELVTAWTNNNKILLIMAAMGYFSVKNYVQWENKLKKINIFPDIKTILEIADNIVSIDILRHFITASIEWQLEKNSEDLLNKLTQHQMSIECTEKNSNHIFPINKTKLCKIYIAQDNFEGLISNLIKKYYGNIYIAIELTAYHKSQKTQNNFSFKQLIDILKLKDKSNLGYVKAAIKGFSKAGNNKEADKLIELYSLGMEEKVYGLAFNGNNKEVYKILDIYPPLELINSAAFGFAEGGKLEELSQLKNNYTEHEVIIDKEIIKGFIVSGFFEKANNIVLNENKDEMYLEASVCYAARGEVQWADWNLKKIQNNIDFAKNKINLAYEKGGNIAFYDVPTYWRERFKLPNFITSGQYTRKISQLVKQDFSEKKQYNSVNAIIIGHTAYKTIKYSFKRRASNKSSCIALVKSLDIKNLAAVFNAYEVNGQLVGLVYDTFKKNHAIQASQDEYIVLVSALLFFNLEEYKINQIRKSETIVTPNMKENLIRAYQIAQTMKRYPDLTLLQAREWVGNQVLRNFIFSIVCASVFPIGINMLIALKIVRFPLEITELKKLILIMKKEFCSIDSYKKTANNSFAKYIKSIGFFSFNTHHKDRAEKLVENINGADSRQKINFLITSEKQILDQLPLEDVHETYSNLVKKNCLYS